MLTHNGCSCTSSAALQPVSRQAPPELTAQRLRRLCLSCRRSCSRSGGLGLIISCRLAALLWWAAHALLLRRTARFLLGLRLLKEAGESILLFVVVRLVVVPLSLGGGSRRTRRCCRLLHGSCQLPHEHAHELPTARHRGCSAARHKEVTQSNAARRRREEGRSRSRSAYKYRNVYLAR